MKGDLVWVRQALAGEDILQVNPNQNINRVNPASPARWFCPLCQTEVSEAGAGMPHDLQCIGCKARFQKMPNYYIQPYTYGYRVVEERQATDRIAVLLDMDPEISPDEGPSQEEIEAVLDDLWGEPEKPVEEADEWYEHATRTGAVDVELERIGNMIRRSMPEWEGRYRPLPELRVGGWWMLVLGVTTEEEREAFLERAPQTTRIRAETASKNIHYWFEGYDGPVPLS